MLHYKGVSTVWWAEAVNTAVYLINRSTNATHPDSTPYELGFKVKPRMEHLRVFGSEGYAHIDDVKRTKLEPKRFCCMFLGYAENTKGYRLFDLDASTIKLSRSVKLDEREVGGIYDTQLPQQETVIHVTKDSITESVPLFEEHQQSMDEPMEEAVDEPVLDVEMNEVELDLEPRQSQLPPPEPTSTGQELTDYQPRPQAFHEDLMVFNPNGRGVPENLCSFSRMDRTLMMNSTPTGVMDFHHRSVPGLTKKACSLRQYLHMLRVLTVFLTRQTLMRRLLLVMKQLNGVRRSMQSFSRTPGTRRGLSFHVEWLLVQLDAVRFLPRNATRTVE